MARERGLMEAREKVVETRMRNKELGRYGGNIAPRPDKVAGSMCAHRVTPVHGNMNMR